jgi:hypothetical protein
MKFPTQHRRNGSFPDAPAGVSPSPVARSVLATPWKGLAAVADPRKSTPEIDGGSLFRMEAPEEQRQPPSDDASEPPASEVHQLADGTQVGSEGYIAEGTQIGALPQVHDGNADDLFTEFKAKPPQIPNQ